jgi:hypothetical protein
MTILTWFFEFKPLIDGGTIDRYKHRIDKLQEEAQYLRYAKYSILTNFSETIVYGSTNGKELIGFRHPKEYIDRFEELWQYSSKERASR